MKLADFFRGTLFCAAVALFAAFMADAQEAKKLPDALERGRGYKPLAPERFRELHAASVARHGGRLEMLAKFQALPASFDCRDKGWVIPVGDQAQCGSCYLYSTAYGTLTQAFVRAGYGKPDGSLVMSVQYGMDCHDFGGCNGGNGTEVIDWVMKNGWYAEKWVDTAGVTHNDYPTYIARSSSCRKVAGAKLWKISDWGFVSASANRPATTLEIKTALFNYGPLNVSLDAGGQFGNGTGTITSLGRNIDHEIEAVAYDDAKDGGAFLLKNQWSKDWGNGGYRWVTYSAAQNLVDIFFVSATALPPPPPPPTPIPPSGTIVLTPGDTFTIGGVKFQVPLTGNPVDPSVLDALQRFIDAQKVAPKKDEEPKKVIIEQKSGDSKRLDDLEKNQARMLALIEKLYEKVGVTESRHDSKILHLQRAVGKDRLEFVEVERK